MKRNAFAAGKKEPLTFRPGAFVSYRRRSLKHEDWEVVNNVQLLKSEIRRDGRWWMMSDEQCGNFWRPETDLSL